MVHIKNIRIPFETAKRIPNQIKNCIALIESKNEIGFFCKIPFPDNNNFLPVFIYPHESINQYSKISFSNENYKFNPEILFDKTRKFFTYINYDVIEIKKEDNFNINEFLEIDDNTFNNDQKVETYITGLDKDKKERFSTVECKIRNESIIKAVFYEDLMLGQPVLNLKNMKIIAIGNPTSNDKYEAIRINGLIEEFNKSLKKEENIILEKNNCNNNNEYNIFNNKNTINNSIKDNNVFMNTINENKCADCIKIKKDNDILKNRIKELEIQLEEEKMKNKQLNEEINNYKYLYPNKDNIIIDNEIQKEKYLENYPIWVTKDCSNVIFQQMKDCICKIYKKKGGNASGFFCRINYKNKLYPVLMTNQHVIDDKYVKENKLIKISIDNDKDKKDIVFSNRKIYSSPKYDTTIIELKNADKVNNFLEIDKDIFEDNSDLLFEEKTIYDIHYPKGGQLSVSYGTLKDISDYEIRHYCNTDNGSSGSPIITLSNNKVIGIHKGGHQRLNMNVGTFLKYPILEFINNYLSKK